MSGTVMHFVWGISCLLLTGGVFIIPFLPAWKEWRNGADVSPPYIDANDDGLTSYQARIMEAHLPVLSVAQLQDDERRQTIKCAVINESFTMPDGRVMEQLVSKHNLIISRNARVTDVLHAKNLTVQGAQLPFRASADDMLVLKPKSQFFLISARLIQTAPLSENTSHRAKNEPHDEKMFQRQVHEGDLRLTSEQRMYGNLVIRGNLHLEKNACLVGNIKVKGHAYLDEGAQVIGALFAEDSIKCEGNNWLKGPVSAGRRVDLGAGVQIGSESQPCSVSGWQIFMLGGIRIYGSMAAIEGGKVLG